MTSTPFTDLTTKVAGDEAQQSQIFAWINGNVTGGPNGDGSYPFTQIDGTTKLIACPAKILLANGDPSAALAQLQTITTAAVNAAAQATASGTVASALAISKSSMTPRDDFVPAYVATGYLDNGTLHTDSSYASYYYILVAADEIPSFQINYTFGSSELVSIQSYSSPITTAPSTGSFISALTDASAAPVFTNLSPANGAKTVAFVFNRYRVIGSDSYTASVNIDFKILPPNTGSDKPRGWGRYITRPEIQPMLGEVIAFLGDSRIKNSLYNAPKRVSKRLGMTMAIIDANGRSDAAQAGRRLAQALYHSDPSGSASALTVGAAITTAEVQSLTQAFFAHGHNDLFYQNPGLPTPTNIAAVIGNWTDPAITPAGSSLAPSDLLNAPAGTTMCSKVRTIVQWMLQQNPQLKITFASVYWTQTAIQNGWLTAGQTEQWLVAWRDQLKLLCSALSIGFFDWMATSGINQYNYAAYLDGTGIHLSETVSDRNAASPSGYDLGEVSQMVQYYTANGIPKKALALYESVP